MKVSNLFLIFLCLSGCNSYNPTNYTPDNKRLTTRNILAVRPGMSVAQVTAILGEPVEKSTLFNAEYGCECNPRHLCGDSSYSWQYTTPRLTGRYPLLRIDFNKRNKVEEVYVQRHDGDDNPGIYLVRGNPCDESDPIVPLGDTTSLNMAGLRGFF